MKFNFLQPKYILPLLCIPFFYIFNFLYLGMSSTENTAENLEEQESLITSIPKPDLENLKIDDKLENLKKDFKEYKDFSAIADDLKEDKEDVNTDLQESLYTEQEAQELMNLRDSIKELKNKTKAQEKEYKSNYSNPRATQKSNTDYRSYQEQKTALEEKQLSPTEQFAKEMRQIDSLLNPQNYTSNEIVKEIKPLKTRETKKIAQVKTVTSFNNEYFNTISSNEEDDSRVEGLLDERITVHDGSRVRIKLASDIMIDSVKLEKNSYIYGEVTGFKRQRILIGITNIIVKGKIYEVKMNLYDLDGMRGLYIPSSKFREFTKTIGGETSENIGQSTNQQTQTQEQNTQAIAMQVVSSISNATTKALGAFIKKNRAHLKYNTNIYLINEKN